MKSENILKKLNAIGLDADMYDELMDDTEIRVRMDGKIVYKISKTDANKVKVGADYGWGKQYFIPIDNFKV